MSPPAFAWDKAQIATLRHSTLPWSEPFTPQVSFTAASLESMRNAGTRDRLSVLAQFAAHHAFLHFCGIPDGDLDAAEWCVIRKRASDCRLVRIAAKQHDPDRARAALTLLHEFAALIGAPDLDALRQPWGRPDAVYAEVAAHLRADAAADLRWLNAAASGQVLAPGADVLNDIWQKTDERYSDPMAQSGAALRAMSALDPSVKVVQIGTEFPIQAHAALAELIESAAVHSTGVKDVVRDTSLPSAVIAERLTDALRSQRHVLIVGREIDDASSKVLSILETVADATWLVDGAPPVPKARHFIVATQLGARTQLERRVAAEPNPAEWLSAFVRSTGFAAFLDSGQLPADEHALTRIAEPRRSYVAALSLLGTRIPSDVAVRFLQQFLFNQPLEELSVHGLTGIENGCFVFASDDVRELWSMQIPAASRPALCRAAAAVAEPARAALLLLEAGDPAGAAAALEVIEWNSADEIVRTLWRMPRSALTPSLGARLAHALVDSGRYRHAVDCASGLPEAERDFVLARCERRRGDYATALQRLDRMTDLPFPKACLRAELLRLAGDYEKARAQLDSMSPLSEEDRIRHAYELAALAIDRGEELGPMPHQRHYYVSRFETYRALSVNDCEAAERHARTSIELASCATQRMDAWLDLVYASFSAGRWDETRSLAFEALTVIGESQGDRAAAGILFTLAYLAADDGQWASAAQYIERLRRHYSSTEDAGRLFELNLLTAHLALSRSERESARKTALTLLGREALSPQIREAAALIVDEIDWIEHRPAALKSSGGSGNAELDQRHRLMRLRRGLTSLSVSGFAAELSGWETSLDSDPPPATTGSQKLRLLRSALGTGRRTAAQTIARQFSIELEEGIAPAPLAELAVIQEVATADFPFAAAAFGGSGWCYGARNRLGHWTTEGPAKIAQEELDRIAERPEGDWMHCSEREVICIEGAAGWSERSREAVAAIVRTRAENARLRRLTAQEDDRVADVPAAEGIIGDSAAVRAVFEIVDRIARRDVPVCILGESGTGKELAGRAIHRRSTRRQKVFTAVNCAALPENLIESELFGHVRGAFTGADRDRIGVLEATDGGTLFLDEIGEMPLPAQAKLLRFLQEGEFRRVGESTNRRADVRIVSATNRRLDVAIENGTFREDLYYRIRGVEITLPPLRDRGADVMLLAQHFLSLEWTRHRTGPQAFSEDVETLLRSYAWPGNVRELQNAIRGAHALAGERRVIDVEHLPERLRLIQPSRAASGSYQDAVARFRRELIERSLLAASGNQNRAAAMLNISRQALAYQIRELGILVHRDSLRNSM